MYETDENSMEELTAAPDQTGLVQVALLMRIYDVQLAILKKMDPGMAKMIHDTHAEGENFNPALYIPDFGTDPANADFGTNE